MTRQRATFGRAPVALDLEPLEVIARLGVLARAVYAGSWLGGGVLVALGPGVPAGVEDPFAIVDAMPEVGVPDGAVGGGWFGSIGYPSARFVEPVVSRHARADGARDARLAFHDTVLRFAPETGWWIETLETPARAEAIEALLTEVRARLAEPARTGSFRVGAFQPTPSRGEHLKSVAETLDRISAGEIFQANITLSARASWSGDPLALFLAGVRRFAPARAAYLADGASSVVSFSPELFLERVGDTVVTEPIKGTRPRTGDEDGARAELEASAKDRAENVMIVDLMRNDLGRVCRAGTVRVPSLCAIEPHPGVWHLVSRVTGSLQPGITDGALLRACFPPGSVTGTPKLRAMEIIDELEARGREAYTGAIGFVTPRRAEWNVAIRTFEITGNRISFGVGGGIVAESDPQAEYEECLTKAAPMLTLVDGELRDA